ncbi:MAG: serine O-acetyltransferase [Candidatus Poriferisodalaceae bacterium]
MVCGSLSLVVLFAGMPVVPQPTSDAVSPQLSLGQQLREDLTTHKGRWSTPGFQALAVHRFGTWALGLPAAARKVTTLVYLAAHIFVRNVYGIELPREAFVGRRVLIGHQHGIVIVPLSEIGDDSVIRHNVTLGVASETGRYRAPKIGRGVSVSPGATILGGVRIGDGATIGPGAIVITNIAAGATVFPTPTRVVGGKGGN